MTYHICEWDRCFNRVRVKTRVGRGVTSFLCPAHVRKYQEGGDVQLKAPGEILRLNHRIVLPTR